MTREELKTATNDELIDELNYCGYDSYYRDYRDDVVAEIKKRMQDSILDKIRAEIEELDGKYVIGDYGIYGENIPKYVRFWDVLQIIDKYKADLEELEPKTGYWFVDERPESNREIICSNCEQPVFKYHKFDFDYRPNYCPNCGAKMVET